jgi:hypothetical protein
LVVNAGSANDDTVTEYAANANGNVAPIARIAGPIQLSRVRSGLRSVRTASCAQA